MKVLTLKGKGSVGLITYLRTDSTRISEEADSKLQRIYRTAVMEKDYVGQNRQ